MALSFTRAVEVEAGQVVTSSQLKSLARAVNDRIRAFNFVPWRLVWFWHNLFRQVRNPAEPGFVFPPQAEFFHIYQHLDPEHHGGTTWPVAGPGEFEGANLASPMMQYVYGIAPNLDSEDVRINDVFASFASTATLEGIWALGKDQRGLYDPISTAQNAPALAIAQKHFEVVQPWWSPHGKALGGWLAQPVILDTDCGATADTGLGIPSYELKWTSLATDQETSSYHGTVSVNGDGTKTVTYAGTCPCGTTDTANGHVIGIAAFPAAWYVAVLTDAATCTYAIDVFLANEWIEGPYEGEAELLHTEGKQLQRALWSFFADFRGTDDQRDPDTFNIRRIAFDNQDFWTRQYALAPNKGRLDGDSLFDLYPRVDWTIPATLTIPENTLGTFTSESSTQHVFEPGFVCGGAFARATKLVGRTTVEVLDDSQLLGTLDLIPDSSGTAEAILWFKTARRPDPLRIRLGSDAVFQNSTGTIYAETTEQIEYKPQFWDGALVTRVSASSGGDQFQSGVDGRGRDYSASRSITDNFVRYGALVNTAGVRDLAEWVNDNPVFDAARRLSRDHMRIMRRQQLISYEVTGGKSVFRFLRFAYGLNNIRADCFHNIAPPLDAVTSGALTEGETYIVRGGRITYRGADYFENQTFTATAEKTFIAAVGAALYVYDGIKHTALKKGFTNEWTMFIEPRTYHPAGSNIWKPEAYSDYFTFCNRCHFYSGTGSTALRRFAAYNHTTELDSDFSPVLNPIALQVQFYAPEVPDQFNYTDNANQTYGTANFFSSCQVLNPPYEIESCVVDNWQDDQIIKVTLKTRLRSHPDAPASVNVDPLTWSADEILILRNQYVTDPAINEDYRTDDNAIREYVLSEVNGNYECIFRTGDKGTGASGLSNPPDTMFGSCYTPFFFARLVPEPYDDGDDIVQGRDSRCLIDSLLHAEVAVRTMCEGFVDSRTSQEIICQSGSGALYDYTFQTLCFEAFGGLDIGAWPLAVRDDRPGGFGPLPNSTRYAEVFNRLSQTVNLLDKVRLDVPIQFSFRTLPYTGTASASPTMCSGTSSCSKAGSTSYAYLDAGIAPPANTAGAASGWATATSISATQSARLDGCPFELRTERSDVEFKVEIDPNYVNAVPAAVQELVNLNLTGFMAEIHERQQNERRSVVGAGLGEGCYPPGSVDQWFDSGTPGDKFLWSLNTSTDVESCEFVTSGVFTSPGLLHCDYMFGNQPPIPAYCFNGPASELQVSLLADQEAYVQVPIV